MSVNEELPTSIATSNPFHNPLSLLPIHPHEISPPLLSSNLQESTILIREQRLIGPRDIAPLYQQPESPEREPIQGPRARLVPLDSPRRVARAAQEHALDLGARLVEVRVRLHGERVLPEPPPELHVVGVVRHVDLVPCGARDAGGRQGLEGSRAGLGVAAVGGLG